MLKLKLGVKMLLLVDALDMVMSPNSNFQPLLQQPVGKFHQQSHAQKFCLGLKLVCLVLLVFEVDFQCSAVALARGCHNGFGMTQSQPLRSSSSSSSLSHIQI